MGIFQSAKCLYFAGTGQMLFGEVSQKIYCFSTIFTECSHYKLQAIKSNLFVQSVVERISTLVDALMTCICQLMQGRYKLASY